MALSLSTRDGAKEVHRSILENCSPKVARAIASPKAERKYDLSIPFKSYVLRVHMTLRSTVQCNTLERSRFLTFGHAALVVQMN